MSVVKKADAEPIPGYRLLEKLGQGGFGEVWKCEAPGGLFKAIKFVSGGADIFSDGGGNAEQELQALQRIKSLRHPFLLSIERVEQIDGELLLVTELADSSLHDLLTDYRARGEVGIPRGELLAYLREAAEVLDLINLEHGLQHLDVKPRNLFLVSRHVKVADFGLVNALRDLRSDDAHTVALGAITPVYAAPEAFLGRISRHSDQYSLACTYQELLTGAPPFTARQFARLCDCHLNHTPDLAALAEADRVPLARALAKEPGQRFPSCMAFVEALAGVEGAAGRPGASGCFPVAPSARPTGVMPALRPPTLANVDLSAALDGGTTVARGQWQGELAGYRFVECLGRLPGAEVWKAVDGDGKERQVKLVFGFDPTDGAAALERLQRLRHPLLPETRYLVSSGRLAVVTDPPSRTLADDLRERQQDSGGGLDRGELVEDLLEVAAGLDELRQRERLRHLTLSPRQFLLDADRRLQVGDFGLAELVWLPGRHAPGDLNPRYAAPELCEGAPGDASDQYSLALIFYELLTGVHPFRAVGARQMANTRLRGKPDVSLLPGSDRAVLLRALHPDPAKRFSSCVEFVEALADPALLAGTGSTTARRLPKESMTATGFPRQTTVAPVPVVVRALRDLVRAASEGTQVSQYGGQRCRRRPGPLVEFRCFAPLAAATVALKLNGFRKHWNAQAVAAEADTHVFRLPVSGGLLARLFGRTPALEVQVRPDPCASAEASQTAVTVLLRPHNCSADRAEALLKDTAPAVLDSLRRFLQAEPERREDERWPLERPVQVCPYQGGRPSGDAVAAQTKDVSLCGLGLFLPQRPQTRELLIRIDPPHGGEPLFLAGEVVNARPCRDGRVEVGIRFVLGES